MSKNKKNTQEKNNNSTIKTVALIAGVAVGSAVGTGASVFIANHINNKDVNTDSGVDSSVVDSVDSVADNNSTGDDGNVELVRPLAFDNDSDRQNAIDDLETHFNEFLSKPQYFEIQVGSDSYETHLVNTKGERIVQSTDGSYVAIFTSDNKSVRLSTDGESTSLSYNSSADAIWSCKNAISNIKNGVDGYTLEYVDHTSDNLENGTDNVEYVIDISGRDACIALYDTDNPDADLLIGERLIDTVTAYIRDIVGTDWTPHMEVGYMYSDTEGAMITYLNVIFDTGAESNWLMLGSLETLDWELDDYWKTAEFSEDNAEELADHMINNINEVYDKMGMDDQLGRYGDNDMQGETTIVDDSDSDVETVSDEDENENENESSTD